MASVPYFAALRSALSWVLKISGCYRQEGALQVPVNIVKSSGYDLVDALLGEDASE